MMRIAVWLANLLEFRLALLPRQRAVQRRGIRLSGREADHIIIHRPYETHQYFMTFTDLDGTETIVTAEFIFENGLLQDWFVYHEK